MKRLLTGLLLLLFLLLTGCTPGPDWRRFTEEEKEAARQGMEAFLSALTMGDGEAVRALFAPNVRQAAADDSVKALLSFTGGKTLTAEDHGTIHSSLERMDGKTTGYVTAAFDLYVDGVPYDCRMEICYRCDEDAGEIGVHKIYLASDDVRCDETYSWPAEDGLHVLTETADDFITRRVGGNPERWTETDRRVPEAALMALLQEDVTREQVVQALGSPNAQSSGSCIYQLEDARGEERYAALYFLPDGRLQSVSVYSGRAWLREIWRTEKE